MNFRVEYHPLVVKLDLPKLDSIIKLRIRQAIEKKLMEHPEIFGIPLRHSRKGHRKLRVGDYRIVFVIKNATVKILIIEHRSTVYAVLARRSEG